MDQKNPNQPQESSSCVGQDVPEGTQGIMVVVVPLELSPFVMPEDSYDFALPLFGGTIPHIGS